MNIYRYFIYAMAIGAVLFAASPVSSQSLPEPLVGIDAGIAYFYSVGSGNSAAGAVLSIPVLRVNNPPVGRSLTLNVDAIGLATKDTTTATVGGSLTLEGLSTGSIQVGAAFVPVDYMKWTIYAKIIPFSF